MESGVRRGKRVPSVQELRHLNELRAREAAQEMLDEAEMLDPVVKGVKRIDWRWRKSRMGLRERLREFLRAVFRRGG
jgi:hypothetical protein